MVKVNAPEVPPPGDELKTVTVALPAVATSAAVMAAVNCVLLTKVVVRVLPFQRTAEPLTKLLPVTVRLKAALPARSELGFKLVIVGAGLLIVKLAAPELPPPGVGLKTVTFAVPAEAASAAVMLADNCVLLAKVVVRSLPFQRTTEFATNPVPFTIKVKVLVPAVTALGLRLVIVGAGLLIVKVIALVVPPPGVGLNTVTSAVPVLAKSVVGSVAVNCVALTNVVVRSLPFQRTFEVLTKFVPLTVKVNPALPMVAEV